MKQWIKYRVKGFYAVIGIALNFVILFNLFAGSFHDINENHHHQNEQTCTPEFEKDACHRYLVHHEESAACNKEHKHLSSKSEECFVCKFYKERHNNSGFSKSSFTFCNHASEICYSDFSVTESTSSYFYNYLRGPPSFLL